jgi:YHS domain-containing protein
MNNWNYGYRCALPATVLTLFLVSGCTPGGAETAANREALQGVPDSPSTAVARGALKESSTASDIDSEHGHLPGAHGGIMVSLGRDSYHVEAVIDSTGSIRLYTLGKDESRVIDVEVQTLKGFIKAEGDLDSKAITFEPLPQDGDQPGRTSVFMGEVPQELRGRRLDVTIPNIRIDGERFRLGFISGQESHDDLSGMPSKVGNDAERELYLTAGGRYTAADIAANGNVTASQKFKGIKSAHDMKPKAGDMLCPISGTKANSTFTWVIDGKSYEFCCPPCVDEFLASAKESSDPLPDPDSFIKK